VLQAHDLQSAPESGLIVQCCGDCHLMNFGGFASPERALIFDINDFDETLPGPFEWDVKRLATSFVLAARFLGFEPRDARRAATSVVAAYRFGMARFAEMTVLETWYARITMDDVFEEFADDPKIVRLLRRSVQEAVEHTSEHIYHKVAAVI